MTTTHSRYSDSGRSSTGLAITIALHAGVAALALAGLGVIKTNRTVLKPIIVNHIPDPATVPPLPAPPPTTDLPVTVDVTMPVVEPTSFPDQSPEPPIVTGTPGASGPGPTLAIDPVPPPGPTTAARFDKRHAGSAQPPYPPAARRLGEEGTVVVHVRIGRDGRVLQSTLAQSSGSPRLDAAAVAHALGHWRFTPALRDGVAVEDERDISVRFELSQPG